jgi:transposase
MRPFKGIICDDISEFESFMPSHAVRLETAADDNPGMARVKTAEQQASQLLHRGREQLVRQRTMLVNALRAHLAEFGLVAAQGLRNVGELIAIVRDDGDKRLPAVAREVLQVLANQIEQIEAPIAVGNRHPGGRPDCLSLGTGVRRLARFGAAADSTGGKTRLGGITKRGNRYLRRQLINGASTNLLRSRATKADPGFAGLLLPSCFV